MRSPDIKDTASKPIEPLPTTPTTPTNPLPPPIRIEEVPTTTVKPVTTIPETGAPTTTKDFSQWVQNAEIFAAQTVYFDFDKAAIKSGDLSKVEAVATQLKGMAGKAVRIEGHCDERGTEEYNRSLGERRALAVRESLIRLGVAADMIDTISYGEDRPAEQGHSEVAWSKNRRGVFILLTPPGAN